MQKIFPIFLICLLVFAASCDKSYQCTCSQDVAGIDTTFTVTGQGREPGSTCDAFDSETTEYGITKTIDCEPQ